MKIERIETIPVNVPLKPGMTTKTSHGEHVVSPYVIVLIHTDSGQVGVGEATLAPRWSGETNAGCVAAIDGLIAPAISGEDPRRIEALRRRMDRVIRHNPFTKAAVEMALWDLAGKSAGVPVYELLGGALATELPLKMVVGGFEVERAVELASKFLLEGARSLKVKVGFDLEQDIQRVAAVRELAGSEVAIGVDANCGWSIAEARTAIERLEPFDLAFLEQPIATNDPQQLGALRARTVVPIMADESVFTPDDAWRLTACRAVDLLSVYPGKQGGIAGVVEVGHIAKAAGISCTVGSNLELGVGTAAMLHVAAASDAIDSRAFPGDFIGPLYHEADLLKTPLRLGPQHAVVPDRPGLGVELDDDQLREYRDQSRRARSLQ